MSRFGDSDRRNNMNYLYDYIEDFFQDGGNLDEFFEVLQEYFRNNKYTEED